MTTEPGDESAADRLAAFLARRLVFVAAPTGEPYASRIGPSGVDDYPVASAAFRDVARRFWVAEHDGEPFDEAALAIVQRRLLNRDRNLPVPTLHGSATRALRALRIVTSAARAGKISRVDLHALASELRAAIEAAEAAAGDQSVS